MFWEPIIEKTSNFARLFHSGVGLLAILPFAVMVHPSMKHQRIEFLVDWFFGTIVFLTCELILYAIRSYRNNRNGRQQVPREKKLSTLLFGTQKLVIAAVIQLYAFFSMEENPRLGCSLLNFGWEFATISVCSQISENSYMCKFPERFNELYVVMAMVSLLVVVCTVFECLQVTCILAVYSAFIACLLTDLFMISFDSSEIHFLGDFLGKRVVCKDTNGNEYKGDFVSVEDDISTSRFMRLVLKNVEKESDGMFVPHADSVHVDEISSLQLAGEAAILM